MKYLTLLLFLFLISTSVFAYPVPKELEDGKIEVKTKDGIVHKFDSNEYKVVKRGVKAAPKKTIPFITTTTITIVEKAPKTLKNRVTLLGGISPEGTLNREYSTDRVKIYTKSGLVIGASYDRKFDDFSVRGTFLSNETYLLGLGWDF